MKVNLKSPGFSLIEVTISVGVLALLVMAVFQALNFQSTSIQKLTSKNQALDVRRFISDNFSCRNTVSQSECATTGSVEVPILSFSKNAIISPGDVVGKYKLRALCGGAVGPDTVLIEYDRSYLDKPEENLSPQWEDLFSGIPLYCGANEFGDCSAAATYSGFGADGKTHTACFPIVLEEDFNAFMVLLRDTSDSMDDFNAKYGNAVTNNVALEAANLKATTFTCSNSASGGNAINNVFRSLAYRMGTSATSSNACPAAITNYVNNLDGPQHLILFVITDHFPASIQSYASNLDGIIPMFHQPGMLTSYINALSARPNISSVTLHGTVLARTTTHVNNWVNLPSEFSGHLEFSTVSEPEAVFAKVAEVVKEKKILRTVELGSLATTVVDPAIYLNGSRLNSFQYKIEGTRLILSNSLHVNMDDVVFIRY